jgi:hypothetical protein
MSSANAADDAANDMRLSCAAEGTNAASCG